MTKKSNFGNSLHHMLFKLISNWKTIPLVTNDKPFCPLLLKSSSLFLSGKTLALNFTLKLQKRFLVGTLFLVDVAFNKHSILRTNFRFFSMGENISLAGRYLEVFPRQIKLGMRCFQTLQVRASPVSCKVKLNNTFLQCTGVNFIVNCGFVFKTFKKRHCHR